MPSHKQSMAGSLFQTISRLCNAVAFGIATAVFDGVQRHPSTSGYYAGNAVEPYAAVFWFAAAAAFPAILMVPFLRIGTQGNTGDKGRAGGCETDVERGGEGSVAEDEAEKTACVRGMEKGGLEK